MFLFAASSKKWGVLESEMLEVRADPFSVPVETLPSHSGNDRTMIVGYTQAGSLLEVGIEFLANDMEKIFHAKRATSYWRNKAGL